MSDTEAIEAVLWADLSNRMALGVILTATVEAVEQQARCDIIAQRGAFVASLAASLAERAFAAASKYACEASRQAAEAANWRNVLDAAAAEAVQIAEQSNAARLRAEAAELRASQAAADAINQAAAQPPAQGPVETPYDVSQSQAESDAIRAAAERARRECAAAETRLLELKTKELAAAGEIDAQQATLHSLRHDAAALKENISALRTQELAAADALRQRQVESLEQRRELEGNLSTLRVDVRTAQEHLMVLRTDIAALEAERQSAKASLDDQRAIQARVASVVREMSSGTATVEAPVVQPEVMTAEGYADPQLSSPSRAPIRNEVTEPTSSPVSVHRSIETVNRRANLQGGHGSIESGLQALQSVRDQLRELRGQSSGASATFTMPTRHLDATDSVQRAQSAYYASPREGLIGAARLQTSASAILDSSAHLSAASPWKQRLVKLQGDLKALRSELGQGATATA